MAGPSMEEKNRRGLTGCEEGIGRGISLASANLWGDVKEKKEFQKRSGPSNPSANGRGRPGRTVQRRKGTSPGRKKKKEGQKPSANEGASHQEKEVDRDKESFRGKASDLYCVEKNELRMQINQKKKEKSKRKEDVGSRPQERSPL